MRHDHVAGIMDDMNSQDPQQCGKRLRTAIRLHNTGVQIMRQNLVRRYPHETPQQINQRLASWLGHEGFGEKDLHGMRPGNRMGRCAT